jgi:FkbM family methyltransferase
VSRLHRAAGLARSLLVYHAIPGRQPRLRRLYRRFVSAGDLVFDLGAHVGNRTRAFRALGCRVIALEPQPDCARVLRAIFARSTAVTVVESAVGAAGGRVRLTINERHPTLTTAADDWREERQRDPRFANIRWDHALTVPATTLDHLIDRFGEPAFVKIDVEGGEPDVLAGLGRPLASLSFEYLPGALDAVRACARRLARLGTYRYNWSPGESFELASGEWLSADGLEAALATDRAQRSSGDVYARLEAGTEPGIAAEETAQSPDRARSGGKPRREATISGRP